MKVLLIDIDSKIPNLALKKIEKYYLDNRCEVIWNFPLAWDSVDKIYVSCIFDWNKNKCKQWEGIAEIGGSGYDLSKTLPPEIDAIKPKINIGFTSRGCIRQCPFCIVPTKEGKVRVEGDIYDIWDGKSRDIILMDNNILALPEHFKFVCSQLRREKLRVDFNQGLDHRLLNKDILSELTTIRHVEYRFAFDNVAYEGSVLKAISLLQEAGINRCSWYVLVGYDSTFEDDLYRLNLLKEHNQSAYVQRYKICNGDMRYIALARWVNQHHIFQGMTWLEFLQHPDNKRYRQIL